MNIGQILKRTFGPKLNILTSAAHESFETNLAMTGHQFYSLTYSSDKNPYKLKNWDTKYRPLPANYTLLSQNRGPEQVPDIEFDLVLSHHKFGQIQTLGPIAEKLRVPLIQLEHTIAYDSWPQNYILNLKKLRGHHNVFISEHSRNKWMWGPDESIVIRHGINTDLFKPDPRELDRTPVLLSVCNDWINRDEPCGYSLWKEVSQGLPVKVVGATPGLSEPAKSLEELVGFYQDARVVLNTSIFSPVPMSLMEAMSCGCCPVSTATCMIPELIEDGVNGFISNDPKKLREYCSLLLHDGDLALRMGRAARETIMNKFSLGRFVDDWNQLFQKAVEN